MDLIQFGKAFKRLSAMQVSLIEYLSVNYRYIGSVSNLMNLCGNYTQSGSAFKFAINELIDAGVLEDTHEKHGVSDRFIAISLPDDWADTLILKSETIMARATGRKRDSSEKVVFESPDGVRFVADSITAFIRENQGTFKNANSARTSFCSKGAYAGWKCTPYDECVGGITRGS